MTARAANWRDCNALKLHRRDERRLLKKLYAEARRPELYPEGER